MEFTLYFALQVCVYVQTLSLMDVGEDCALSQRCIRDVAPSRPLNWQCYPAAFNLIDKGGAYLKAQRPRHVNIQTGT